MDRWAIRFVVVCVLATVAIGQSKSEYDDFDTLLIKSYNLFDEYKYDESIAAATKASGIRPTDSRPYALSGMAEQAKGRMEEASNLFAIAIKYSPANPMLYYLKARADHYRNASEEGLASIRKAIALKPDYAAAYVILGELLNNGAERDAAFRKAVEIEPKIPESYYFLGMHLENVKKDEKAAEEAYRTAIDLDPGKMVGRFSLGRLLVRQGRLVEARKVWDGRTSEKDNTFPNFITLLTRAENLEKAKQAYGRSPDDPEVLLQIGLATMDGDSWVVDGRWEEAIIYFKRALELKPNFAKAQYAICKAYVEMADVYKEKNRILDKELVKLRRLDSTLANDIVEYRRTYSGGLRTISLPPLAPKQ